MPLTSSLELVLRAQDAELAITLLYELGEGASEEAMKPGTGALAQLAQGKESPVPCECSAEEVTCAGILPMLLLGGGSHVLLFPPHCTRRLEDLCTVSDFVNSHAEQAFRRANTAVRRAVCRAGLMQMDVPASEHRLVALTIMETYVRYTRVLLHALHCLPAVLQTFLGTRGIGHPDKASRAPYCDGARPLPGRGILCGKAAGF